MVPRSEEIIKSEIIEQLTWDTSVNANEIQVEVEQSVVKLTAQVDEKIGEIIREAFRRNSLSERSRIEVEVDTGRVRLKGSVPDYPTKIQAHNIAIYTEGVTDVVDEMTIE